MPIGSFGSTVFQVPELLTMQFRDEYNYVEIPKLNGFPAVQQVGDRLSRRTVQLRFHHEYNISPNPQAAFDSLRSKAQSGNALDLTLANKNWGTHVILSIDWSVVSCTEDGEPYQIDASVTFLNTPLG